MGSSTESLNLKLAASGMEGVLAGLKSITGGVGEFGKKIVEMAPALAALTLLECDVPRTDPDWKPRSPPCP